AGLIDVLDRADGAGRARPRQRTHRSSSARATGYRPGAPRAAVRGVPLRSVPPAPMARRTATVPTTVAAVPAGVLAPAVPSDGSAGLPAVFPGRLHRLSRRVALWGAGPEGAHLAWRVTAARPMGPGAVPGALRRLARRIALWGA